MRIKSNRIGLNSDLQLVFFNSVRKPKIQETQWQSKRNYTKINKNKIKNEMHYNYMTEFQTDKILSVENMPS